MAVFYRFKCWDGSEWDFGEPDREPEPGPHVRLRSTPTGVGGGGFKPVDRANRGQAGVTWFGQEDDPTVHRLEVMFGPMPPGDEAVAYWAAWRKALGRGRRVNTMEIESDNGGIRTQRVRLASIPNECMVNELYNTGFGFETVEVRSDETWFRGKPVDKTLAPGEWPAQTLAHRGDVASWPKYTITGPITNPTLGVEDELVTVRLANGSNFTIPAGHTWVFETDPEFAYIHNNAGNDGWWQLGNVGWYTPASPPEGSASTRKVPLTITGSATSSATRVRVELPQLFHMGVA